MTLLPISLGSGSAKPLSTSDSQTLPDLSTALKKKIKLIVASSYLIKTKTKF